MSTHGPKQHASGLSSTPTPVAEPRESASAPSPSAGFQVPDGAPITSSEDQVSLASIPDISALTTEGQPQEPIDQRRFYIWSSVEMEVRDPAAPLLRLTEHGDGGNIHLGMEHGSITLDLVLPPELIAKIRNSETCRRKTTSFPNGYNPEMELLMAQLRLAERDRDQFKDAVVKLRDGIGLIPNPHEHPDVTTAKAELTATANNALFP